MALPGTAALERQSDPRAASSVADQRSCMCSERGRSDTRALCRSVRAMRDLCARARMRRWWS